MNASISIAAPGYNYLGLSNYLNVNLARYTASEAKVAHFCIERTARFNKRSERIPMRHMLHGIPKVIAGLGLARNTIKRALRGLERKGFIKLHPQKDANGRDAAPRIEIVCKMSHLKISKKHRAKELGEGSTVDHLKEEKGSSSVINNLQATRGGLHAVVEGVRQVRRRSRKKKAHAGINEPDKIKTSSVSTAWRQLMLDYYPELGRASFSKKTGGRVTGQLRQNAMHIEDPYDFMEWCIINWNKLKRSEFKNWDLIKPKPEISVWGLAMPQFVGFYMTREYYDKVKTEGLAGASTSELERQLTDKDAQLYEVQSRLQLLERLVEKHRSEKNGR